jgi:UDP-glucuronate decarboxylase
VRSSLPGDLERITAAPLPWGNLAGKTVLVTGAAGFLASCVVEALLHRNDTAPGKPTRVLGLVRDAGRARDRFRRHIGRDDLVLLSGDATAPPEPDGPVDFIIHAASQSSPRFFSADPVGTLLPNTSGSEGFLFVSSGEVYGRPLNPGTLIAEDDYGYLDPAAVRSCYGESKRMGETMVVAWHHQHGVPGCSARLFHTYGPGLSPDDGRVFADFVFDVVNGRDIVLHSDGRAVRAFCYLSDAVAAIFTVLLRGEPGNSYNVGVDTGTSVLDLAEIVAGLFPERGVRVVRASAPPEENYLTSPIAWSVPDISRLRGLGWAPMVGLVEGFRRTILACQEG